MPKRTEYISGEDLLMNVMIRKHMQSLCPKVEVKKIIGGIDTMFGLAEKVIIDHLTWFIVSEINITKRGISYVGGYNSQMQPGFQFTGLPPMKLVYTQNELIHFGADCEKDEKGKPKKFWELIIEC